MVPSFHGKIEQPPLLVPFVQTKGASRTGHLLIVSSSYSSLVQAGHTWLASLGETLDRDGGDGIFGNATGLTFGRVA